VSPSGAEGFVFEAEPVVLLPVLALLLLGLGRLTRLRPALRPLFAPLVALALLLAVARAGGPPLLALLPRFWLLSLPPLLVFGVRAAVIVFEVLFRRGRGDAPPALLDSVVSVLLYGVGIGFVAHTFFGIELTPFLATSAVVGAVVGLALQDTLGNLFAGIALHTEAPFRVGDWVRVADRDGRIEQVSWRAMRLRTWDGDTLNIPNNEVARHAVLNYSVPLQPHSRVITVGVGYHTPPNRAMAVLKAALAQVEGLAPGMPPTVRILSFQEYTVRYEVRYFFSSYEDYRAAEGEVHRLIWYHFRRAGIEFVFPTSNVTLQQAPPPAEREDTGERLVRALRNIDLFQTLTDAELRTVAGRLRPLHYASGERIIEEGAAGDSFFLVDRGEVRVLRKMAGVPREIARIGEGECFGEMAMLTGQRRTATVVAATDVDVLMIDKAGFQDILAANPEVAVDISALLAQRRAALHSAEEDLTTKFQAGGAEGELKADILGRIRSYFGL
jgi:small-conductance mechanosensitive channel/CRP-like cAMP-binding protein